MGNTKLVERAKMYMQMFINGVYPVTGEEIPANSQMMDEKIRNCFSFIVQTLDEYLELTEKVRDLEEKKEENTIVIQKKQDFNITREQCERVSLSKAPIPILTFMKNINSVIDTDTMEKMSSTRITKWLTNRGLIESSKVQTVINKTVYKPSDTARKIGIIEEEVIDTKSGEVKTKVKLDENAQMFILENIEEIIQTT